MSVSDGGLNVARAIVLISLIIGFLCIWIWAWRKKRKPVFHDASLLPLEEDEAVRSGVREKQKQE